MTTDPIIIVGLGPVGAVLALALHQKGIPVVLIEASGEIEEDQRAATLHVPTLEMLDGLGLSGTIIADGLKAPIIRHWDRVSGELIAEFDMGALQHETRFPLAVQYEHYKLVRLIQDRLVGAPGVEIHFNTRVVEVDADHAGGVQVIAEHAAGGVAPPRRTVFKGAYVVGADGGRSVVRTGAGIEFPGFTYPESFVKIMTPFDFAAYKPRLALRNFFSDPDEWCNLFKVIDKGPPGLWRVVFPALDDADEATALDADRVQARLQKFLPKDGAYDVCHLAVYRVHQRVADRFRQGRVLLVGDAAHLNNPIGGMGMNGGIHDAVNLAEKLAIVCNDPAQEPLLDRYDRQRRTVAVEHVQAQTIRNKKLLDERDPATRRRNLDEMSKIAADPRLSLAHLRRISLIESVRSADAIA